MLFIQSNVDFISKSCTWILQSHVAVHVLQSWTVPGFHHHTWLYMCFKSWSVPGFRHNTLLFMCSSHELYLDSTITCGCTCAPVMNCTWISTSHVAVHVLQSWTLSVFHHHRWLYMCSSHELYLDSTITRGCTCAPVINCTSIPPPHVAVHVLQSWSVPVFCHHTWLYMCSNHELFLYATITCGCTCTPSHKLRLDSANVAVHVLQTCTVPGFHHHMWLYMCSLHELFLYATITCGCTCTPAINCTHNTWLYMCSKHGLYLDSTITRGCTCAPVMNCTWIPPSHVAVHVLQS